ncbi:MAG: prenyltransferase [Candidatus Omnitrophica bacterium]|nr:prenyltransferase [Candidatus Omnitrophota bacterium]MDD5653284.1 prenyltransferase [Candidatus Omnitrophota bacterium]
MPKAAQNFFRALRLPFITASILPFVFGSLIEKTNFKLLGFLLGLFCVAATHLSANLINDYADSKSGADCQDKKFYGFFGGSKLIQEKILSERFFLLAAISFGILALLCAVLLAAALRNLFPFGIFLAIIALSWLYSHKPLQFSYHRLGEMAIFLFFGPAPVMGGYFIQTGIFPDLKSFLLSLPFGFLTTAILFVNEVPDFQEDSNAKKFTWVSIVGARRAFFIYALLILLAFGSIFLNIGLGNLKPAAVLSVIFLVPAFKAGVILKRFSQEKMRLLESSKLAIAVQAFISLVLIFGVL